MNTHTASTMRQCLYMSHSGLLHGGRYTDYVRHCPVLLDQFVANQMAQPVNAPYDQKRVYDVKATDNGEWQYTSDSHVSGLKCRDIKLI